MELHETTPIPVASPPNLGAPAVTSEFEHCDECGAPVDHAQRYCVSCGAHRRNVPDPAATYMSRATARTRRTTSTARRGPARRSGASLGLALVLAIIPVAAAVGVEIGRSSNNQDTTVIRALDRQLALERTVAAQNASDDAGTGTAANSSTAAGSTTTTSKKKTKGHAKTHATASATPSGGGKVLSTTKYGSATQITGAKETKQQAAQGAADAKTIQNSTGQGYVNAASNLPSTVYP